MHTIVDKLYTKCKLEACYRVKYFVLYILLLLAVIFYLPVLSIDSASLPDLYVAECKQG